VNHTAEIITSNPKESPMNVVTFRLDRRTFALPIEPIRQIIEMVTIAPVPKMDHSIAGVINFHGDSVPVVNLRHHLGLQTCAPQLHNPIILVTVSGRMVGLIVDEVLGVLNRPTDQVVQPRDILPEGLGNVPLIRGLAWVKDDMVMLLDLEHLFVLKEVNALGKASAVYKKDDAKKSPRKKELGHTPIHPRSKSAKPGVVKQKKETGKSPKRVKRED